MLIQGATVFINMRRGKLANFRLLLHIKFISPIWIAKTLRG